MLCTFRRPDHLIRCSVWLILLIALVDSAAVSGQSRGTSAFRSRAVDLAILSDGTRLSGVVLPSERPQMLLSRLWLQQNAAQFYTEQVEPQLTVLPGDDVNGSPLVRALRQAREELEQLPDRDIRRIGLLTESIGAVQETENRAPRLLILDFSQVPPRRVVTQQARSQLGFLALLNDIPDAEGAAWQAIAQQLDSIPAARRRTHLPTSDESEIRNQVERILAAVDYRAGMTSRFVSTGTAVIPEDGAPDIQTLLTDLLGQSLQQQLNELLNPDGVGRQIPQAGGGAGEVLPEAARRQAESRGHRTLLISSFDLNLEAAGATVRRTLWRRDDQDQWRVVTTAMGQGNAGELTPDQRETIRTDPRVEQITAIFTGLGIAAGDLDRALQLGAVVQSAAQKAQAALEDAVSAAAKGVQPGQSELRIPVITLRPQVSRSPAP